MNTEELQKRLAGSPFIQFCGMTLVAGDDPDCLALRMEFKRELERSAGSGQFHGGPIAALIDTAGCFALMRVVGHGVPTINFRTDYLRPAVDTVLVAKARVRRAGRTVGVVDVEVFDHEDRLVAIGRATFATTAG